MYNDADARLMRLRLSRVEKKLQIGIYTYVKLPRIREYYTRIIIILGIHVKKHLFERVYYCLPLTLIGGQAYIIMHASRGRLVQEMLQSRSCSVELVIETNNIINLLSCIQN